MNQSNIKALPISMVEIFGIENQTEKIIITLPNLMKESNLIIEDITGKNSLGLDQTLYQKITATIYYIGQGGIEETLLRLIRFLNPQPFAIASIYLGADDFHGRPDAFGRQGNGSIDILKASIKLRSETTQGFLRHVISITGISKSGFNITNYS